MRLVQRSVLGKVLFVAMTAIMLIPSSARAEDASGKFTLKHSVRWGAVVLSPGTYNYQVEHHTSPLLVVRGSDGQLGFIVMPKSVSTIGTEQPDRLELQRDGGEWFVSAIVLTSVGETFHFGPPGAHAELAQASTQNGPASLPKP